MSEFNQYYKTIIEAAEDIRKKVVANNMDIISFGGKFDPEDYQRMNHALQIENSVFQYLIANGVEYHEVAEKPQLITIQFEGSEYIGLKNLLNMQDNQKVENPEKKKKQSPSKEVVKEKEEIKKDITEEVEEVIQSNNLEEPIKEEIIKEEQIKEDNIQESKVKTYGNINLSNQQDTNTEYRTHKDNLVFEKITISLQHQGYNVPEETFEIMCTPLKLYNFATPSVPILVTISNRKTRVTKSSYDSYESGRNLVTIDIKDYSLLCRGSFDMNGNFHTIITTTDKSANQGDIMKVLSQKSYGENRNEETTNGHPVIPYISGEGESYLYVFPLGDINEDNFIILSHTEEFINYLQSSSDTHGAYKATIEDDGITKTIIPHWNNDYLEVDILEV